MCMFCELSKKLIKNLKITNRWISSRSNKEYAVFRSKFNFFQVEVMCDTNSPTAFYPFWCLFYRSIYPTLQNTLQFRQSPLHLSQISFHGAFSSGLQTNLVQLIHFSHCWNRIVTRSWWNSTFSVVIVAVSSLFLPFDMLTMLAISCNFSLRFSKTILWTFFGVTASFGRPDRSASSVFVQTLLNSAYQPLKVESPGAKSE